MLNSWVASNKGSGTWPFTKSEKKLRYNEGSSFSDSPIIGGSPIPDLTHKDFGSSPITLIHSPCGYWSNSPTIEEVAPEPPPEPPPEPESTIHNIRLDWTDNSANELGFKVQRRISLGTLDESGINTEAAILFINTYSPDISIVTIPVDSITPKLIDFHVYTYRPTISIVPDWTDYALLGANVTTFTDYGVDFGTRNVYLYRLYAYNGVGNSDYSNVAQTPSIPATVRLITKTFVPTVG